MLDLNSTNAPHPAFVAARATDLPLAYLDEACGTAPIRKDDLIVTSGMPSAWMIERISAWTEGA
jgi:hypothetical protein